MVPRLRGVSKTPFWLLIFTLQVIPMTGIVAMTMLLGGCSSGSATSNNLLYYLIAGLGAVAVVVTAVSHCVVSLRVATLASMLQQDPQVIVGDPMCLLKLSRTPWYGVSEIDYLQLAIVQTYNAYALNNATNPQSASHYKRTDSEFDRLEWRTAASEDDRCGASMDEEPFDALKNFMASQQQGRQPTSQNDDEGSSTAHPLLEQMESNHVRRSSLSGASAARSGKNGSVFQRLFTPRGPKAPIFPIAAGTTTGVSADQADGIEPLVGSLDSSQFHSLPASVDERSGLFQRSVTPTAHYPGGNGGGGYGATQAQSINTSNSAFVEVDLRGRNSNGPPINTVCLFDPNGDNNHPEWSLLSKGLKLQSSIFLQLLSTIRVGQSLSSVTLPVHILESRSLLEMLSDMFVNWELLMPIAMGAIQTPEDRVTQVFKWFIAAFHLKPHGAKKPYNSILGEVFQCKFPSFSKSAAATYPARGGNGERSLVYIAEQVSHHPPVSAFCAEYANLLTVRGVYMPKGKMVGLNCAASIGEGSFVISFPTSGHKYRVTFPTFYVSGIMAGTPQLEVGGTVTISDLGQSACNASVEFFRKGWLSGSYDQIHCIIRKSSDPKSIVNEFVGTWHGKIFYKKAGSPAISKDAHGPIFFDPQVYEAEVGGTHRPLAVDCGGHPKQSRAVWAELTPALRAGNAELATAAKTRVEVAQRLERKLLAERGKEHETKYFQFNCGRGVKDATDEERCDEENWDFVGGDQMAKY